MTALHIQLSETVQTRLESISMRLDAATDNLLQTRDLLISHFENQLLQLQEVRTALHETAQETVKMVQEVGQARIEAKGQGVGTINPMQNMTLEALFAPLNAAQHLNGVEVAASAPVEREALPLQEVEVLPAESLFESEPLPSWEPMVVDGYGTKAVYPQAAGAGVQVMAAAHDVGMRNDLDPALEKATLDELNEALTRAFAQIATRQAQGLVS